MLVTLGSRDSGSVGNGGHNTAYNSRENANLAGAALSLVHTDDGWAPSGFWRT